jgi:hypothetical protein
MLRTFRFGLLLWAAGAVGSPALADAWDWRDAYERLLGAIRPGPGEAPWRAIPWQTSLSEARRRAAAEGKPLFVWCMAGEPLGCA